VSKNCTSCKFYDKKIKSSYCDGMLITVCTGNGIDIDNCNKYNNYRGRLI
jgi:hypothetical protein